MSLCLALLLGVIAINWWQGWKPFKHPLQMPGNVRPTRLSAPAIEPPIGRRCARAAEHIPLGGSHQQPGIGLQARRVAGIYNAELSTPVEALRF